MIFFMQRRPGFKFIRTDGKLILLSSPISSGIPHKKEKLTRKYWSNLSRISLCSNSSTSKMAFSTQNIGVLGHYFWRKAEITTYTWKLTPITEITLLIPRLPFTTLEELPILVFTIHFATEQQQRKKLDECRTFSKDTKRVFPSTFMSDLNVSRVFWLNAVWHEVIMLRKCWNLKLIFFINIPRLAQRLIWINIPNWPSMTNVHRFKVIQKSSDISIDMFQPSTQSYSRKHHHDVKGWTNLCFALLQLSLFAAQRTTYVTFLRTVLLSVVNVDFIWWWIVP